MLYSVGMVVIPGSFDVDHDAGTLLAVVLIVAIGLGLGSVVRGRRRPVIRAGGFGRHEPTPLELPGVDGVVAPDGDHDAITRVVPSCGRPASGVPSGGTRTPVARVLILCPCTNTPVPTDLEMDAEAFAVELGADTCAARSASARTSGRRRWHGWRRCLWTSMAMRKARRTLEHRCSNPVELAS